jgi:hypothetical protein
MAAHAPLPSEHGGGPMIVAATINIGHPKRTGIVARLVAAALAPVLAGSALAADVGAATELLRAANTCTVALPRVDRGPTEIIFRSVFLGNSEQFQVSTRTVDFFQSPIPLTNNRWTGVSFEYDAIEAVAVRSDHLEVRCRGGVACISFERKTAISDDFDQKSLCARSPICSSSRSFPDTKELRASAIWRTCSFEAAVDTASAVDFLSGYD